MNKWLWGEMISILNWKLINMSLQFQQSNSNAEWNHSDCCTERQIHRKDSCSAHMWPIINTPINTQSPFKWYISDQVTFSAATWSPWRGDLYGAQVVRRLVCGRSYKVVVEAIVAEFEQLHEQTVLRLIVQVQVLPRSLETNKHSASINRSLQETTY